MDAALRYLAVSTALANFDSYQGNFAHNYYLYEQDGVFIILPWDLNMSFAGFGGVGSNVFIDEPTQGSLADRSLIAKLFDNPEYLEVYHGYLAQVAAEFLDSVYLEAEIARLHTLIADYVRTDPTAFYTFAQFEQSLTGTVEGAGMGEENEQQEQNPNRQGFRMGGMVGFGGNVPGLLELASTMSESIFAQLAGEKPSVNNGLGSGGVGGGNGGPGGMPGNTPEGNWQGQIPSDFPGRRGEAEWENQGGQRPGRKAGQAPDNRNPGDRSTREPDPELALNGYGIILLSLLAMDAASAGLLWFRRRRFAG